MNNFELIDDYLANRLQEQDRKAFVQQLDGDPALKEEVEFQKQVVEGVRHARTVELKNMLSNVPVGGSNWSGGKIAAGVISAGIIATTLYFYLNDDPQVIIPAEETQQEIIQPDQNNNTSAPVIIPSNEEDKEPAAENDKSVKEKSPNVKKKAFTPVRKPDIEVVDPSSELTEDGSRENTTPGRTEISTSKMEVITESADKKHTFHYQFVQGKLLLFGPFDNSLYEILEIHGEEHAVFLFYRENYYLLNEKQTKITHLAPIQDSQLLQKLKEYRGR